MFHVGKFTDRGTAGAMAFSTTRHQTYINICRKCFVDPLKLGSTGH